MSKIKRKICIITGTRAEYGLLKPVMMAVKNSKTLELFLMVTGMHLSEEFGKTIELIEKDGFKISYKVKMNPKKDNAESMAKSIGRGIIGIAESFRKTKPDITVVLGDRIEALAGAIASAYINIPVAHIHGGDVNKAGLDELARHAITKMSHIHFPATKKSMERIIRMGEDRQHVFLTGAPGLDSILKEPVIPKSELARKINASLEGPFLLLLQHSVTTQIGNARAQIRETLAAIEELKIATLIIYPNSDAGGRAIIEEIEKKRNPPFVRIFKNLPHDLYLGLLKYASVLVGNSSSGIIEAPSYRLPVVNIGIRQEGRQRSTNIIDAPHDKKAIARAIRKALYDKEFRTQVKRCRNPYGDGKAGARMAKILSKIKINHKLLQKRITY